MGAFVPKKGVLEHGNGGFSEDMGLYPKRGAVSPQNRLLSPQNGVPSPIGSHCIKSESFLPKYGLPNPQNGGFSPQNGVLGPEMGSFLKKWGFTPKAGLCPPKIASFHPKMGSLHLQPLTAAPNGLLPPNMGSFSPKLSPSSTWDPFLPLSPWIGSFPLTWPHFPFRWLFSPPKIRHFAPNCLVFP